MEPNKVYSIIIWSIIAITIIIGALISANILRTKWTKDLLQVSLEKGQNPLYVKCAMETNSSNECRTLVTAIAVSKSDK